MVSMEPQTISVTSNGNIENDGFGETMMKSFGFSRVNILHFAQNGNNDYSEFGIVFSINF